MTVARTMTSIPKTMLAAEWKVIGDPYHISDVPVPSVLAPFDLLVRVAVASFCHTDMITLDGQMNDHASGLSGGHEVTGTVVAVGSDVKDVSIGARVATLGWYGLCGECGECKSGIEGGIFCDKKGFLGSTRAGGFCEYTIIDSRQTALVPENLSFATAAPLTCAGVTAYMGLKKALMTIEPGSTVALFGAAGGVGHLGLLFVRVFPLLSGGINMGNYKIVAVEARDSGLEWCKANGASAVADARLPMDEFVKQAQESSGTGTGYDACVVFSDHDSALPYAVASTRTHGTVVQIGQPAKDLHFYFRHVVLRDVRIIGSMLGCQNDLQEVLDLTAKYSVPVAVSRFQGVARTNEVLQRARKGDFLGKLVIVVDESADAEDQARKRV